jgi:hypothetical protein
MRAEPKKTTVSWMFCSLNRRLRLQILGEETDGTRVLAFQEVVIQVGLWLRTHIPIIGSHV